MPLYKLKATQADVPYSLTTGRVTDAEGNEITDAAVLASLKRELISTDETVVKLTPTDAGGTSGTASFVSPGNCSLEASVKTADGILLAAGSVGVALVAGDPSAVDAVSISLEGLTAEPDAPPVEPSSRGRR